MESLGGIASRDGLICEQISDICSQLDHLVLEDASNLLVLPTIEHLAGTVMQDLLQKLVSVQPPSDWNLLHGVMERARSLTAWTAREYLHVAGLGAVAVPPFAQMQRDLFCVPPWIAAMLLNARQKVITKYLFFLLFVPMYLYFFYLFIYLCISLLLSLLLTGFYCIALLYLSLLVKI
jgi:hypothetical protein